MRQCLLGGGGGCTHVVDAVALYGAALALDAPALDASPVSPAEIGLVGAVHGGALVAVVGR